MKLANNIVLSVFVKPGEDCEKIKAKLLSLVPFELEKEKIHCNATSAVGFNDKIIKILEIKLEKEGHTTRFLKHLNSLLPQEKKELLLSQENRLDDRLNFFIRLDKEKFLEGICRITDQGNCFHIKMNIAAFPRKREEALKVIREIFK